MVFVSGKGIFATSGTSERIDAKKERKKDICKKRLERKKKRKKDTNKKEDKDSASSSS